jgi:hypothetical protein
MYSAPQEEIMYAGARIDLAHRRSDGIDVVLWWSPEDDTVAVEVLHLATDATFELAVERSRALEAFYHPFAYASRRQPELLDVAAA